ncbi:MAG: hypothetical protein PHH77_05230 [Victivallaceae bacterium]|nr:hypothetical protein [Victivallaceae bacterium]
MTYVLIYYGSQFGLAAVVFLAVFASLFFKNNNSNDGDGSPGGIS